jgi:hypothetical protein
MSHDQNRMVIAHKAGREYALNGFDATLSAAQNKARHDYATEDERMSFVAGYLGELRRMTGASL